MSSLSGAHVGRLTPHANPPWATNYTGRYHAISGPYRLFGSNGPFLPKTPMAPATSVTIPLSALKVVPKTGVRALAGVLTTLTNRSGTGFLRYGGLAAEATMVADSNLRSNFVVLPVVNNAVQLTNGPLPTYVAFYAVGWFSSAAETGNAGLLRTVGGRHLATVTLNPGANTAIAVRGVQDIPATGVASVLLRAQVDAAQATGLQVSRTGVNAGGTTIMALSGTVRDYVLTGVGTDGKISVRNISQRPFTISLDTVGWFTDGTDAQATGDHLELATPFLAANGTVGPNAVDYQVCGRGGIPGSTSAQPASLVVAAARATNTAAPSELTADPAGATALDRPLMTARKGATSGTMLVSPGLGCAVTMAPSAGALRLAMQPYGWFSGGLVLSKNLHVLTAEQLATVSSVTATAVRMSRVNFAAAPFAVGDIIVAPRSATTPQGFMRRVTAVTAEGFRWRLTTVRAGIGEAVLQGSMSTGQGDQAPITATQPTAMKLTRATARAAGHRELTGHSVTGSCTATGQPLGLGAGISCSANFSSGIFYANVSGAANSGVSFGVDVHWGLPPSVNLHSQVGVSTNVHIDLGASASVPLDESFNLPTYKFPPVDIQLGPVPLVLFPEVGGTFDITGNMTAGMSVSGDASASASVSYDSDNGFVPTQSVTGSANGAYKTNLSATAKAALNPEFKIVFEGDPVDYVGIAGGPYAQADADACNISIGAGAQASVSFSIGIVPGLDFSKSVSFDLGHTTLFQMAWRDCAIWSGTVTYSRSATSFDDQGRLGGTLTEVTTFQLPDPGDLWAAPQPITMYGTSTGESMGKIYDCGLNGQTYTTNQTWSGAIVASGMEGFALVGQSIQGKVGFADFYPPVGVVDGVYSAAGCYGDTPPTANPVSNWSFNPFQDAADKPVGVGSTIAWSLVDGQMTYSGHSVLDTPQINGGSYHQETHWTFSKRCQFGVKTC